MVLKDGVLYLTYDRIVCNRIGCAGMTARETGTTIGGFKVVRMTAAEKAEWIKEFGEVSCECGALVEK